MDVHFTRNGLNFVWNADKAVENVRKHRIRFEAVTLVFADPFVLFEDASVGGELREAAIGQSEGLKLVFVIHMHEKAKRFALFQREKLRQGNGGIMKTMRDRLKQRMRKDRPMTVISMRIPDDVIEDLKEVAPTLGFSGYQPLMRAYIGQGLRKDLARLENSDEHRLTESLRRQGISDEIIATALAESKLTVVSAVVDDEVALAEVV